MSTRSRLGLAAASILAAATMAVPTQAEVAQKGGVRVSVTGKMTPTKLPRRGTASVAVSLAGHITAAKADALPQLAEISFAINSYGELHTKGIPLCRLGHINPSTTAEALAACRSSLIGEGHFSADVRIPEQSPFPSEGKLLAFNGKLNGRPALFAHIYGTEPVPTSYVLPFLISKGKGTFGTALTASLPKITGKWGYVTGVSLDLQSRYLAAGCPAPKGFPSISFPLLKASFGFAGGPTIEQTLIRNCKAKD
jgi:hypothetical protein